MKRIVLVTGGFDPLHSGHIAYFKAAKELGNELWVGVNSDEWLTNKKGMPFMPVEERIAIIKELAVVDNVITFEENNIDYYRNNYFYIENINKPIKSITSYTKDDLLKIAEKLNIDITNKSNKKDIYEKIINKIDL